MRIDSQNHGQLSWLKGSWYCEEWETNYLFEENKGQWTIKYNQAKICEDGVAVIHKNKVTLTSKNGTKYHIKQLAKESFEFYQTAKVGLMGATNLVIFHKESEQEG